MKPSASEPAGEGPPGASALVERLAALPKLAGIPRAQLEWLARRGTVRRFPKGAVLFRKGAPITNLYVVLSGRFSIQIDRGGVLRRVREWCAGDLSGVLPYSRLRTGPGDVTFDEPTELLMVDAALHGEMILECHELTAHCVHEMLERARQFRTDDLQVEKMASLGRLAAGLAHELNNPSSAMARNAREFDACRMRLEAASRRLGAAGLTAAQLAVVDGLNAAAETRQRRSPIERADREDALGRWLEAHDADEALADALADTSLSIEQLDEAARGLPGAALEAALDWLAAETTARALTREIATAAERIHSLVAAVKSFSRMDRAPALEPVDLAQGLQETLTLLRAKAKNKSVDVALRVEARLPEIHGYGGELNQVWVNLLDNAIDAAPDGGHVEVAAFPDPSWAIVTVTDNGPGIPENHLRRIFEPFFTTKPVGQGTGLGLDIAQNIVHRHGGAIEIESAPGRTVFRVRLPIAGRAPQENS
jgi:signal transduction histidine kinase